MSIYGWFKGPGKTGYGYNSTSDEVTEGLDLSGKTYLLTGCNSGIGEDTLRVLLKRGAHVIAAARTEDKASRAIEANASSGSAEPLACELSDPDHVRKAVESVVSGGHTLDGIIANAGIMALPERNVKHGHELQFLTNHIGHFLLVTGVLDQLADDGRVVVLSSTAHQQCPKGGIQFDDISMEKNYSPWGSYGQSKLANLLFAKHLARRLADGQTANSVHPGVIWTNLGRHMPGFVQAIAGAVGPAVALKQIPQGSATQVYVATHPDAANVTGEYFSDCNIDTPNAYGRDAGLAEKLWAHTEQWVAEL
jgi:WW domain-containing oxidoreductase